MTISIIALLNIRVVIIMESGEEEEDGEPGEARIISKKLFYI